MVVVLSFAMGVHVPLVMQLFMRPLQVFQQPLVRGRGPKPVPDSHLTFPPPPTPQIKKYLLGSKDKVWKERLVTEAAAQDTSGLESFILEQWEKNEAIDMAKVKQGVETDGWDLNYQTSVRKRGGAYPAAGAALTQSRCLLHLLDCHRKKGGRCS